MTFRRILCAIDGSPSSRHALGWTRELAALDAAQRAEVVLVDVAKPAFVSATHYGAVTGGFDVMMQEQAARAESLRVLDVAADELLAAGIQAREVVPIGGAGEEIVRVARDEDADLVVLGSHTRGVAGRIALGSVGDIVRARLDHGSLLVARGAPRPTRIVVPVDDSIASGHAAAVGAQLARAWGAEVSFPHFATDPAECILELVKGAPNALVVMGSRGLRGLRSFSSVSRRVVHDASCSVLMVKEAAA